MNKRNGLNHLGCMPLVAIGILTLMSIYATGMLIVSVINNSGSGVMANAIIVGAFVLAYEVATITPNDVPKI